MGKSSRAATNRDKVLSSGIFSCPLPELPSLMPTCLLESFPLALSKYNTERSVTLH